MDAPTPTYEAILECGPVDRSMAAQAIYLTSRHSFVGKRKVVFTMRFVTFSSILVAIVAAPAIHASVLRCGTNAPSNELKNIHATHAGLDEIERLAHPARAVALEATRFVIDTYVHIIYAEDSDPDNLPNETIYDQVGFRGHNELHSAFLFKNLLHLTAIHVNGLHR
jgi:hypothetical protein